MKKKKSKKPRRRASRSPGRCVREEARRLLGREFVPIPVNPRSKQPIGKGWQKQRPSEDDIDTTFPSGCNIGVLLGAASRHLVDVDLDCPQAVAAADLFMPPTGMTTGRPGAPGSHRFYLAPGARTTRFESTGPHGDGERDTLVELRSSGAQTLLPPSKHPSGEVISYECDGDPAEVDAQVLRSRVALVAITALMARLWPAKGKRHAVALSLAGFLLTEQIECADVENVIRLAAQLADDTEAANRVKNVATTAKKLKVGQPVTGEQKLTGLIGEDAVCQMRAWLRPVADSNSSDGSDGRSQSRSSVDALLRAVDTALEAEVFRSDREPCAFVTATTKFGRQTFPLPSKKFRFLLGSTARRDLGRAVSQKVVDEVIEHLQGEALFGCVTHDVYVRI
ncbi:MAG: bifunctional DNA primase/polymerase, partial [Planctomycetes bacterium]|nr:bifunctional DNA primase/polymerase [Planctomycetota bacterium]